ncbi:NAD(P)/FAD-dependent oxidoreductase [Pseudomonas sp. R3.Fl]|uniref:flavin-containing monooxygenase n=1 Tax=Pseudomonas TaxID=286 RepID=UPI00201E5FFD|nr:MULTISPECIES: NAD(P)/FAD-dependent oxidoreductase [Pseudomonas]MCL6692444.1 NAD(P)/FAD-dependent oxidoreductase [Pseudomonas sp. R3.Fl]UUC52375.1 NAD(P)/FAD-dependent oxidoreductase [Pseudomonas citronellolis]
MTEKTVRIVDAVVIGAGMSGLYMTKKLVDMGLDVQGFEAGDNVGGTWYWNRYPGARVDLESFDYSFSFSEELQQEWNWSERYAAQPEILSYLNHVADRFELRRHFQFQTRVTAATYEEKQALWAVHTDRGETLKARYLISGVGVLSEPKAPELDGLSSFKGATYHTGRWPHEGVDFTGKRVAVFGTGSSGIQVIPIVARQAAHLSVFQRTPVYCVPTDNYKLTDELRDKVKQSYAARRQKSRYTRYGIPVDFPSTKAFDVSAEEREKKYEQAWGEMGHLLAFRMTYADILADEAANKTVADFFARKIRGIVKDPAIAEKLIPTSYPFGTKRPCLGIAYYETFNRDNVSLVDLRETPVERVTETGILTRDGVHHEFDAMVFATGYDALTGAILRVDLTGRNGRKLQDKWRDGPRALLGISTSEFPNFFMITGPLSPGPLNNMAVSIEQHVEWVTDCIAYMRRNGLASIEADQAAEENWFEHVQEVVSNTLYLKANSWYLGANVPGKPRVFIPYLGGAGGYREKCDEVANDGYRGFIFQRLETPAAKAGTELA